MKPIILITIFLQAVGISAFSQPRNIIVERNKEYTISINATMIDSNSNYRTFCSCENQGVRLKKHGKLLYNIISETTGTMLLMCRTTKSNEGLYDSIFIHVLDSGTLNIRLADFRPNHFHKRVQFDSLRDYGKMNMKINEFYINIYKKPEKHTKKPFKILYTLHNIGSTITPENKKKINEIEGNFKVEFFDFHIQLDNTSYLLPSYVWYMTIYME